MRFVKNGPDVPEQLVQAHEDGQVVFFCGAGISYPAGLPGFNGLVSNLFESLGERPNSTEQAAIDGKRYDLAVDLLERRLRNRLLVREKLRTILTPSDLDDPVTTQTHRSLLTLGKGQDARIRLITTNFDRIFHTVAPHLNSFNAPLLPIPKMSRWDGLVYLHGLLPESNDPTALNNLIVSSGDFGLAYLTERWASRFVTELLIGYTVCFVGYSAEDPVLRYMLDALSADRLRGESSQEVFAFASYRAGQYDEERQAWNAKGVIPILYLENASHELLHHSLHEWAKLYRDGLTGKSAVITQLASAQPSRVEGDAQIDQVLWAITDPSGVPAKTFANLEPPPPIEWLDVFSEKRFSNKDLERFGIVPIPDNNEPITFSLLNHPTAYDKSQWSSLSYNRYASPILTEIQFNLAKWLVKHLDNPRVLHWVIANGGSTPTTFSSLINGRLEKRDIPIPLLKIWNLICSGFSSKRRIDLSIHEFESKYKTNGWSPFLRIALRELLRPVVEFREPYRWAVPLNVNDNAHSAPQKDPVVKDYVQWEVQLMGGDQVPFSLAKIKKFPDWPERATECLSDFTTLLQDALELRKELEGATELSDHSYIHRPNIGDHPQNRDFHEWTVLITLCRDAFLFAVDRNATLARAELERWQLIRFPIFRRLIFFIAANSTIISAVEALSLLLEDKGWWLWSVETKRESIRLLVSLAPRLNPSDAQTLCQIIMAGPPRSMYVDDLKQEEWEGIVEREIWLRLEKIKTAKVALTTQADNKLNKVSSTHPQWKIEDDERDEFPFWMESGSGASWRRLTMLPHENSEELAKALQNPAITDHWYEDNWSEICQQYPAVAIEALKLLAARHDWPIKAWREALHVFADAKLVKDTFQEIGPLLTSATPETIAQLIQAISWWLSVLANSLDKQPDVVWLRLIDLVLNQAASEEPTVDEDPVHRAINHPLGHATEALIRVWLRSGPKRDQALPEFFEVRLSRIADAKHMKLPHGRFVIASYLISLFVADSKWIEEKLISYFDWNKDPHEARIAWEGYLRSPRLTPDLLNIFKSIFLNTANYYNDLDEYGDHYASLLTMASLNLGEHFSVDELRTAFNALPPEGLAGAAEGLAQAISHAGDRKEDHWINRTKPLLESIWPKSAEKQSPDAASAFAKICVNSGARFPEAVRIVRPFIVKTTNYHLALINLAESDMASKYPQDTLDLLDRLVDERYEWPPDELAQCLEQISNANADLTQTLEYRRLSNYLARRGH